MRLCDISGTTRAMPGENPAPPPFPESRRAAIEARLLSIG
jgi:hypothetical protein